MTAPDELDPLRELRRRRVVVEVLIASLADAHAQLRAEAVAQVDDGAPKAHVAIAAGVTRPTLYAWLRTDA